MVWYDLVNIGLLVVIWIFIGFSFANIARARMAWLLFFATYSLTEFVSIPLKLYRWNNLLLYNISKPIQFLLLLTYLTMTIEVNKRKTALIILAGALLSVIMFSTGELNSYKSLQEVIFGAVVSLLCVIYFYNVIRAAYPIELSTSEFWYCSALFIFFGSSFAINASLDYLIRHDIAMAQKLFYGLVFSSYLLYGISLYAVISNYPLIKKS